jgi:four helix bundle protein
MRDEATRRKVQGFEDLLAWQMARELVREINSVAESAPVTRLYAFRDQLQRAAVSVMSNIAEGYDRGSRAEFFHMLSISKGSCAEVRSLLYVAIDAGYIDQSTFARLNQQTHELSRVIGALRAAVGRQRDAQRASR